MHRGVLTDSSDLSTKRELLRTFGSIGSARVLTFAVLGAIGVRLVIGQWTVADGIVAVIGVLLIPIGEWVIHRHLFHASSTSRRARWLGMGRAHRRHHEQPTDLEWVMLPLGGALLILVGLSVFVAVWVLPLAMLADVPVGPVWLTATVIGWLAAFHYEWTHLLIHSRVRPRTAYYRNRARNHRLHHYRNEQYWLGVTTNVGDRLLGTMPELAAGVPMSPTARTLEQ